MIRTCTACGVEVELDDRNFVRSHGHLSHICRKCWNARSTASRAKYRERRNADARGRYEAKKAIILSRQRDRYRIEQSCKRSLVARSADVGSIYGQRPLTVGDLDPAVLAFRKLIHLRLRQLKSNAFMRGWRRANPHIVKERSRTYYAANRDKALKRRAEWAKNNPEKARVNNARNRMRREGAINGVTAADIARQLAGQKGKCWWCGKRHGKRFHVDHRVALSRGGEDKPQNIVISCPTCNVRKHAMSPVEFAGRLL